MCNDAVNWRINCSFVLYINICCFISDFRPVVKFNYVSSPNFMHSRKVLLMSAGRVLIKVYKFLKLSNKQHVGSFVGQPVKPIAYKYCINFAKTKFTYRI